MRTFKLVRNEDESGVSGTGEVAEGVEFKTGKCVMSWDTKTSSVAVYENVKDLVNIHGHQGKTYVRFDDGEEVYDVVVKPKIKKRRPKRYDRFKTTRASDFGNFPEWIGLTGTILEDATPNATSVQVVLDELPKNDPDGSGRDRNWNIDWLELL